MLWTTNKYNLKLNIKIDWIKYKKQSYKLPPEELGNCTDWRFVVTDDEKTAVFTGSWDLRRIDTNNLDKITKNFREFILN